MDLKVGEVYVMKEAETSASGGFVYLKKGAKVRLKTMGGSRVIVQDLSDTMFGDGIWSTYTDYLMPLEEAAKVAEADVPDEEEAPAQRLRSGDIYVMTRNEVSGDGGRIYLKKGARVRIDQPGVSSVIVQDLSEDMYDDGIWITSVDALIPLEDALKVGEVYTMAKAETNSRGDVTFLKKGAKVRLQIFGKNRVVVQDLSDTKKGDGVWYTNAEYLLPLEEEPEAEAAADAKNQHYITAHQPIEVMQANMTHDELIGFLKGNIIKYACRCGRKDEPLKEAEKIKQYAEWLCVVLSDGTIDPRG